ncbi:MAG: hypothetical protein IKC09_02745 [Oscillospiraceae bacterium]|nr:hypothetical protein [Oscillospiraceae bacterium]
MDQEICQNCANYHRHYTFIENRIIRVYCGHCGFPKIKRRMPDAPACQHYIQGQSDRHLFASKEYLSKALIQYITEMELLPEILDMVDSGG